MYILKREKKWQGEINTLLAKEYGISIRSLVSKSKSWPLAHCRFMAYYILRTEYKLSYPTIGALYKKDHTSVMHGVKYIISHGLDVDIKKLISNPQEVSFLSTPPNNSASRLQIRVIQKNTPQN